MATGQAIGAMLRTDGLRLARDRFLLSVSAYILGLTVAMRWLLPWLTAELRTRLDFDFTPYVPLLASHLLIQISGQLGGIVMGMLLLESREDGTVKALLAAPVPLERYLAVLGLSAMGLTMALALLEGAILGWGFPGWAGLLAAVILGAPGAVIFGLLVAAIADDKMQAFAYLKILGLLPVTASIAWFVPTPWQWVFALYPPYCASKVYWLASAGEGGWWSFALIGGAGSALWLWLLGRLFLRAARR